MRTQDTNKEEPPCSTQNPYTSQADSRDHPPLSGQIHQTPHGDHPPLSEGSKFPTGEAGRQGGSMHPSGEAQALYDAKLLQQGISKQLAETLRLSLVTYLNKPAIHIPYFNVDGTPSKFARYRILALATGSPKYLQQTPGVEAYLPPVIDWKAHLSSAEEALIITEGELKAIVASIHNLPTIGIGGVYNFTSKSNRLNEQQVLPILSSLPRGKPVYIVFDADYPPDPYRDAHVARAKYLLAAILASRGLSVHLVDLSTPTQKAKLGMDDFIYTYGIESLTKKIQEAPLFASHKYTLEANILSTYADFQGKVMNLNTGQVLKKQDWLSHTSNLQEMTPAGQVLSAAKIFNSSKYRLSVKGVTFDPSSPAIVTQEGYYNLWRGVRSHPIPADVAPWGTFLSLFFSEEPYMQHHFELWIAHLLQFPHKKQFRIPILSSIGEGIGKTLLFDTVSAILNGGPVGSPPLKGVPAQFLPAGSPGSRCLIESFNEGFEGKIHVHFEEIGEKGSKFTNLIKELATSSSLSIRRMHMASYTIPNYLNISISTNEAYTHQMSRDSRREMVYTITSRALIKRLQEFFQETGFYHWVMSTETLNGLYYHYLNYPIGSYTGKEPAPKSYSKAMMAKASSTDIEDFLDNRIGSILDPVAPYTVSPAKPFERTYLLPALEQLYFQQEHPHSRISARTMRVALANRGFRPHAASGPSGQLWLPNLKCKLIVMCRDASLHRTQRHFIEEELLFTYGEQFKAAVASAQKSADNRPDPDDLECAPR